MLGLKNLAGLVVVFLLLPFRVHAAIYEVGPDQQYSAVGDVPWESLEPGDQVRIHWRAEPYKEKFVICRQGTEQAPIVVMGVAGPQGQKPVLDARDATTRSELNFWNESRGLVKIGGANSPPDTMPQWIVLQDLVLRSAREPFSFTGRDGLTDYAENAAAVYIEKGHHIILRGLEITDSGNGLFTGHQTEDLLVEGCYIHSNGVEGSIYEHNNYSSGIGVVFQFNHFGPLRDNCPGNNLKDRSAGLVVRYNWIESGNRQLDLVDAEDSHDLVESPLYHQTYVYGNILVEPDGAGNSQIVHYGGDSGTVDDYRKGTLYFHFNTVISTRSGNTTLFRLSTNDESADCRNNIIFATAGGNRLAMLDESGQLKLRSNWISAGWVDGHSGIDGSIDDDGSNITGDSPGFRDFSSGDYSLDADSVCIDRAGGLDAAISDQYSPTMQYVPHLGSIERFAQGGVLDLGAFEFCPDGQCQVPDGGIDDAGTDDAGIEDAGTEDAGTDDADDAGADLQDSGTDSGSDPGGETGMDGTDMGDELGSDAGTDAGSTTDSGLNGRVQGSCGCGQGAANDEAGIIVFLILVWAITKKRRLA